ncbi:hypothetical protein PHLCEN_2v9440 [Hermanssonia centrifuga]|uniref:Short-chain dehydrogenase n=1 Tax=Hermanssonia centrifuga TaxID=98765 RepID=A0A2R6NQM7_9APHY|nr:hypothetical protein PHLCEN_2v9440 [Hermanssonia centrifuga]
MSVFNASRLLGKTVLVTGASAGIGAAGSNVILAARRTDALKAVTEACVAAHKEAGVQGGGKFAAVQLDVSDRKQIASFFERVPEDLKKVDILVNNAGFVLGVDRVGNLAEDEIESMFSVNVLGLIAMTQLLVKGEISVVEELTLDS